MNVISITSGRRTERVGRSRRAGGRVRSIEEWKRAQAEATPGMARSGLPAPVDYRTAILRALLPHAVR